MCRPALSNYSPLAVETAVSLGSRLRAPQRIFRRQTRSRIWGQTLGQKPEGPQAPRELPEELPEGTVSPHCTRGFSTDCHSNQISTVNKRTEWKSHLSISALGFSVEKLQERRGSVWHSWIPNCTVEILLEWVFSISYTDLKWFRFFLLIGWKEDQLPP